MPFHKDLRLAGLLPPVDAPHHMRVMEWKPWREGVVTRSDQRTGSFVDVGLYDTVRHQSVARLKGCSTGTRFCNSIVLRKINVDGLEKTGRCSMPTCSMVHCALPPLHLLTCQLCALAASHPAQRWSSCLRLRCAT